MRVRHLCSCFTAVITGKNGLDKKEKEKNFKHTAKCEALVRFFYNNSFGLKAVVVNIMKLLDLFHQRLIHCSVAVTSDYCQDVGI